MDVSSSLLIGEHEASRDCADKYEAETTPKYGLLSIIAYTQLSKAAFVYPDKMGYIKVESDAARGNLAKLTSLVFKDFPGSGTRCNAR